MAIGHSPIYWIIILVLCIGGLLVAWNTVTYDPSTFFKRPVPLPRYIFTFGDSFTATGFDIKSNDYPSMYKPLGNPSFPGNTTSGGPNWVGFMVRDLAPDATILYNFARSGATINDTIVAPLVPSSHDMRHQVREFQEHLSTHPAYAPWTKDNSAVVVWMGINDVTLSLAHNVVGLGQGLEGRKDDIIESYVRLFDSMQAVGARYFILLTVPPVQLNPQFQQGDADMAEYVARDIKSFNDKLKKRVNRWRDAHRLSNIRVLDTYPFFVRILDNPQDYNATDAKCMDKSGEKCLWTDHFHPGQAIQKVVAQKVYDSLDSFGFWQQALY